MLNNTTSIELQLSSVNINTYIQNFLISHLNNTIHRKTKVNVREIKSNIKKIYTSLNIDIEEDNINVYYTPIDASKACKQKYYNDIVDTKIFLKLISIKNKINKISVINVPNMNIFKLDLKKHEYIQESFKKYIKSFHSSYDYPIFDFLSTIDLYTLALASFYKDQEIFQHPIIDSILYLMKHCNGAKFFNNSCYVSLSPKMITFDEDGKIHNEKFSAITYENGVGIYFLSGVVFSERLWHRLIYKHISVKDRLHIRNIEQRRIALSLVETKQLFKELDGQLISKSKRGNELYAIPNILMRGTAKMLKYTCPSTNKIYYKFVPTNFTDADEAQAWSFSLSFEEYTIIKKES